MGSKLTRKQASVISALLTERTQLDAAKKAGVGQTTLYRWLARPDFQESYRTARKRLHKLQQKMDVLSPPVPPDKPAASDVCRQVFGLFSRSSRRQGLPNPLADLQNQWEALPEPDKSDHALLLSIVLLYKISPD